MFRRFGATFFWLMLFVFGVCLCLPAAEVPDELAFQGRLLDIGGVPVPEGTKGMQFSIFDADTGGSSLWDETYAVEIGEDGFYTVYLGEGDPIGLPFDEAYWVEVKVESDLPMVPRFPLKKVAYSFRSDEADLLEGHPASDFAASTHSHLGQDWSGSDQYGLTVTTSHTSGAAISGSASAGTGTNYGGYFTSASTGGKAVYGRATALSGYTVGGQFVSESPDGTGVAGEGESVGVGGLGVDYGGYFAAQDKAVYGLAWKTDVAGYGGYFQSDGAAGVGVYGLATDATSGTKGGSFRTDSSSGTGVQGYASSGTGLNYGGYFVSDSITGSGAVGFVPSSSGLTYGGQFQSNSTSGRGVYGHAIASSGSTYGGLFSAASASGVGAHGEAPYIGVRGISTAPSGAAHGGFFQCASTSGHGVEGTATSTSGSSYGGYFTGSSASSGGGVFGVSPYKAVGGTATASSGVTYGGLFMNDSSSGRAVYGWCGSTGGTTYGVKAEVASANGYAGYFSGGRGVYVEGDLSCSGTKPFVIPHPEDASKEIVYTAVEGPEAGTYIRGTAELVEGEAVIWLPEHFGLVTSPEGLTVSLAPVGEWLQLYVAEKSPGRLAVREASGKGGRFDYLVQGVRKGYENYQVIRDRRSGLEDEPEASHVRPEPAAPYAGERGDDRENL